MITFTDQGSHWYAETAEQEENKQFTWLNVMARWCGYGPMPLFHKEPKRFILNRRRKPMNSCNFDQGWGGICQSYKDDTAEFCDKHTGLKCGSCGGKATKLCSSTSTQFVCNEPLCDECDHELTENGTDTHQIKHVKKCDQKYEPWWMSEL